MSKDTITKKIAVLAVFIFSHTYVAPLKAKKNEIVDVRIAAETDAQADAEYDARGDITQFFCCIGSSTLVTISAIGGAFLGRWLADALDPPLPSSIDDTCVAFIPTEMVCGCLGGWVKLVLQGLFTEYINWEVQCRPSVYSENRLNILKFTRRPIYEKEISIGEFMPGHYRVVVNDIEGWFFIQ